jgi:hypothetical protein
MEGSGGTGGYLPPEPAGPEPELGGKPAPQPPPAQPQAPPAHGWQQPQPPPGQVPPPGQGYPPPPGQVPPPGQAYPPPPGYAPPPGYGYGYPPAPRVPDNGPAVAGFVLSLVSGGLLLLSAGFSSVVSIGCAVAGMIYSRKGKRKVAAGETPKHAGLAQAGWIIGIISLVLSLLATAGWILVFVLAISDEEFRDDLDREFDDSQSIRAALQITAAAVRLLA